MHRSIAIFAFLLVALSSYVSSACQATTPVKRPRLSEHAMWVTRWDYKTAADCRAIAENCRANGIDTILFQVRGNATAFYRSKLEPWAEQFGFKDPGFDPLATMIEETHSRGMRLVAWVNAVPAWWGTTPPSDPNHVYNKHPEWMWYDQYGKRQALSEKFYVSLNPCLPEVRAHVVAVIGEIVSNYAIDGVHLDYMRFPNEAPATPAGTDIDYPRDAKTVALFTKATKKTPEQDGAAWKSWRTAQVTELVRQIRAKVRSLKPEIELSSAVGVKRESALAHHQDAYTWLKEDLVDTVYPMNYTGDPKVFATRTDAWNQAAPGERIVQGVNFGMGTSDTMRAQVQAALEKSEGFAIFAYSSLFPSPVDAVDRPDPKQRAERDALSKIVQAWLRELKPKATQR
ncbi:MAG: family 10 glycosylhydrolase [Planctomycetota bacterium]|nr:family 10 glycosylhydrolase [Planctomycetota bacterium]